MTGDGRKTRPAVLWAGGTLIALALLALPFALAAAGTTWVRITNLAILYVFLSLGLNIVVGFAGLLDLGYIAFYAVGAYVYALLASPHFDIHWPFWAILPLGAAVAAVFGVLIGAPTLKLRGDYLAIVTLGLVFSGPIKYYYLLLAVLLAVIFINVRLQNSRIGRAWEAVREDEIAARATGIDTTRLKLLAFAMGASFGGDAGGMFSAIQGFVSPESFVLVESIMVVSMVVLGGMGNIWGVILGAVLLSFVPEILRFTVEPAQKQLFGRMIIEPEVIRMLIFGFALVLVMTLRPGGLWPSAVRKRELAERKP